LLGGQVSPTTKQGKTRQNSYLGSGGGKGKGGACNRKGSGILGNKGKTSGENKVDNSR